MPDKCPNCGKKALELKVGRFETRHLRLQNGEPLSIPGSTWTECGKCGCRIIGPTISVALERLLEEVK